MSTTVLGQALGYLKALEKQGNEFAKISLFNYYKIINDEDEFTAAKYIISQFRQLHSGGNNYG